MTAPTTPRIGRVAVDPRFRERRIAVRKEAGRRRLRRLVLLVAAALLALTAVVVLESPILDVDQVTVVGARNTDSDAIRAATGVEIGGPLLLADLEAAERAVEAMPWVDDAVVTRDLPSDLTVRITERTPRALVSVGGSVVLVDDTGRVLAGGDPTTYPTSVARTPPFVSVVATGDADLPAPGGRVDRTLLDAVVLAGRLRENPAGAVTAIRLDPAPVFDLADGGRVELGDLDDLDAKVEAFRTVFARVDLTCLEAIDLRVPTHPVLTRRTACS